MKINSTHKRPQMVQVSSVSFGSLIQLHDVPDYWPQYLKARCGRFGKYFLLSSEYYRLNPADSFASRQQLIVDLSTGVGVGLLKDHKVEVIRNAEVVLNENY